MSVDTCNTTEDRKTLPLNSSSYARAVKENQYIVDKTLLIKTVIDMKPLVTVFTRPRRFGKSFNLSMLRAFFEKTEEDTSVCFTDKKIWQCGEEYRSEQGKYPVIYLDFKDIIDDNWDEAFESLKDCISGAYSSHKELLASSRVDKMLDLPCCKNILYDTADPDDYEDALCTLSRMLTDHYGVPPVIFIDEFDTPVQAAYENGYYDDFMDFMGPFLSAALKGNDENVQHAFLCGVLPVSFAAENSGLNSVFPDTVLNGHDYSEYFGFTADETQAMLDYYGLSDKYPEVCEQYEGYRAGGAVLFNPLDILMYIDSKGDADDYWVSTSSNQYVSDYIRSTMKDAASYYASELMDLLEGKPITEPVDISIFYDDRNTKALDLAILVHSGYLAPADRDGYCRKLFIPNKEVFRLFSHEFLQAANVPAELSYKMKNAVESGDALQLRNAVQCITERVRAIVPVTSFQQVVTASVAAALGGSCRLQQDTETDSGRLLLLDPGNTPGLPVISLKFSRNAGSGTCRADVALNSNGIEIAIE